MRPSCSRLATHYETLAIPQSATKAQIKVGMLALRSCLHLHMAPDKFLQGIFNPAFNPEDYHSQSALLAQ